MVKLMWKPFFEYLLTISMICTPYLFIYFKTLPMSHRCHRYISPLQSLKDLQQTSNKPLTNLQQNPYKLPTSLQSSFQHGVSFHPTYKTLLHAPWNMKLALKKFHIILGSCNPFCSSRWSHPLGVLWLLAQVLPPCWYPIRTCKYCQYWLWKNRHQVS